MLVVLLRGRVGVADLLFSFPIRGEGIAVLELVAPPVSSFSILSFAVLLRVPASSDPDPAPPLISQCRAAADDFNLDACTMWKWYVTGRCTAYVTGRCKVYVVSSVRDA